MILSLGMMMKYSLGEPELAKAIDEAVKNVIEKGIKTGDIGGKSTTSEVGDAVVKEITKILSSRK